MHPSYIQYIISTYTEASKHAHTGADKQQLAFPLRDGLKFLLLGLHCIHPGPTQDGTCCTESLSNSGITKCQWRSLIPTSWQIKGDAEGRGLGWWSAILIPEGCRHPSASWAKHGKRKRVGKTIFIILFSISCFEKFMKRGCFLADWDMPMEWEGHASGFYKHSKVEVDRLWQICPIETTAWSIQLRRGTREQERESKVHKKSTYILQSSPEKRNRGQQWLLRLETLPPCTFGPCTRCSSSDTAR